MKLQFVMIIIVMLWSLSSIVRILRCILCACHSSSLTWKSDYSSVGVKGDRGESDIFSCSNSDSEGRKDVLKIWRYKRLLTWLPVDILSTWNYLWQILSVSEEMGLIWISWEHQPQVVWVDVLDMVSGARVHVTPRPALLVKTRHLSCWTHRTSF